MNITTSEVQRGSSVSLEKLAIALQQEVGAGKNRKVLDFREAYLLIEQHLASNGTQKSACESFNAAFGYKLHQPQFRKLLSAERKSRSEAGDALACVACGQRLAMPCDALANENSDAE